MEIKKYTENTYLKMEVTHLLVVIVLLINIVFFTSMSVSFILQVILIVAIFLHNKDDIALKKILQEKEKELCDSRDEKEIVIQKQNNRFEFAINSSRDGFWDYDIEQKEFYLSSGWKERLGFKKDEVITYLDYLSLMPDDNRFEHHAKMHDILEKHPNHVDFVHFRIKYPLVTKAGEKLFIEDVGDAFFNKKRELTRITGFHRNITDQEHQAKIIESQNRISAMGEMISNIAHQWRQPIGAINNTLNDLEFDIELEDLEAIPAESFLEVSKKVKEYTAHMSQTIDDFRTLSSDDKKKTNFLVKDVLEEALSIVSNEYEKYTIVLQVSEIENCVCKLTGYQRELLQVLLNLLNNAKDVLVEKKVEKPMVFIETRRDDVCLYISISDNAGGVPTSIQEKIFDPYFTTKHESIGTGIGLYMSKKIITKDFLGSLEVENIDDGAKFTISLPREV